MGAAPLILPLHCCLLQSGPLQLLLAWQEAGHRGPQLYIYTGLLNVYNLWSNTLIKHVLISYEKKNSSKDKNVT